VQQRASQRAGRNKVCAAGGSAGAVAGVVGVTLADAVSGVETGAVTEGEAGG